MSRNLNNIDGRDLSNLEQLLELVELDKKEDRNSFLRDRYPLRFILFDNFNDSFKFVDSMYALKGLSVELKGIEDWIDSNYPDLFITYTTLIQQIKEFIDKSDPKCDYIIAPFSELSRFYINVPNNKTFEALLKTLKGLESSKLAASYHQRIYIPIVGLEGKMESLLPDSQIFIWHQRNKNDSKNVKLILTKDTYGIKNIPYPLAENVIDWLNLWKNSEKNKATTIICKSFAIFSNATNAQPDNAFDYVVCNNAFELLKYGLSLDLGEVEYKPQHKGYWEQLASRIDLHERFTISDFIQKHLSTIGPINFRDFVRIWFDRNSEFDRWLLCEYYKIVNHDYLSCILSKIQNYTDSDLFREIALTFPLDDVSISNRFFCLDYGFKNDVVLPKDVEDVLREKLLDLAKSKGFSESIKYFTTITNVEKTLAILWLSNGNIDLIDVEKFFPDIVKYMKKGVSLSNDINWDISYFDAYRDAKIKNVYTDSIKEELAKINASEIDFYKWYNKFSTVRTLLENRNDIDVICWIDGLGLDWVSFVSNCIKEYSNNNVFLNEILVAHSLLPSVTETNKKELSKLPKLDIINNKIGDLDSFAHQNSKRYPDYIIDEFNIVKESIAKIVKQFNGKKIAIVSDHGLTYLSQECSGLNLSGLDPNHFGRTARRIVGNAISDNFYIILDDKKTHCALTHKSLCAKTPDCIGTHGGCTPEEVLIPIFVISPSKNDALITVNILETKISNEKPIVCFDIRGHIPSDIPYAVYNGIRYELAVTNEGIYQTHPLNLTNSSKEVSIYVGGKRFVFTIEFELAADLDNDIFNF